MKVLAILFVLVACACHAQDKAQLALLKAQTYGAQFDVRIRVIDDEGIPVEGAKCEGWAYIDRHKDNGYPHSGITDSNGVVCVSGKCGKWVSVAISKEGYYSTQEEIRFAELEPSFWGNGTWRPYGALQTMVLKQIKTPVPLRQSVQVRRSNPDDGDWHGYDLELRDWLSPYGNGKNADMLVRISGDARAPHNFKTLMEISFTNNPFAGAYQLTKDQYSELKSVYAADTNAAYRTSFSFLHEEHPIIHQKPIVYVQGLERNDTRLQKDSYLVFRTRTKVNENGRLVSAHYGKIYGPWEIYRTMHAYGVYFNKVANDTNLEDMETAEKSQKAQRQRDQQSSQQKRKTLWPF